MGQMIQEQPGTIFMQPWWLDAVAPGEWGQVQVMNGDTVAARMPYRYTRKFGMKMLTMPPLTQHLGPWFNLPDDAKYSTQLSRQHELCNALLNQLPPFDFFRQRFSTRVTNWLPFYWQQYNQSTQYTYVIPDITDPEVVWSGFNDTARRQVRKAQKQLDITEAGIEEFYNINNLTFERQGMKNPYSLSLMKRLDAACKERDTAKIFKASDSKGNTHAVLYLVWDTDTAYYLMGGGDPELRSSGAASLLMWEAIRFASNRVSQFDFEGSMVQGIERFFRTFGAVQTPYFRITKVNNRLLQFVNQLIPVLR